MHLHDINRVAPTNAHRTAVGAFMLALEQQVSPPN